MSQFALYFDIGLKHILDINAYDHLLFVIALSTIYLASEWKRVLILVTAFTIGHSITLALSTLRILNLPTDIIEFLIPVTILITAISNMRDKDIRASKESARLNYGYALFFGLIHGLGFSNLLRSLLGRDETIVTQLLAFNIGLEVGQIIIVAGFMLIAFICTSLIGLKRRLWILAVSSFVALVAIKLIWDARIW